MSGIILRNPLFSAVTSAGVPLVGGLLYTYLAGTTDTAKATYTTEEMSVANANPVVLDGRGEAILYGTGAYKLVLKDSTGALIWTQDDVRLGGADNIYYVDPDETNQSEAGAGNSLYDILTEHGTTDQYTVRFPHDVTSTTTSYDFTTSYDLSAYSNVQFELENGSLLNISNTMTLTFPNPDNLVVRPNQRIFTGSGTVEFTIYGGEVYPQWWGTCSLYVDSGPAINSALTAAKVVKLVHGSYLIGTKVTIPEGHKLIGTGGKEGCTLKGVTTVDSIDMSANLCELVGIQMEGSVTGSGRGIVITGGAMQRIFDVAIVNYPDYCIEFTAADAGNGIMVDLQGNYCYRTALGNAIKLPDSELVSQGNRTFKNVNCAGGALMDIQGGNGTSIQGCWTDTIEMFYSATEALCSKNVRIYDNKITSSDWHIAGQYINVEMNKIEDVITLDADSTYCYINQPFNNVTDSSGSTTNRIVPRTNDYVSLLAWHYTNAPTGTWAINKNDEQITNTLLQNTSLAQDDAVDYNIFLGVGTYTFKYNFYTGPGQGIMSLYLDGVYVGAIDHYSASPVYNVASQIAGLTIIRGGLHLIELKIASKNESATDYGLAISDAVIFRTA